MPELKFRDDILKLHQTYLDKIEQLTERERGCYVRYLECLGKPLIVCDEDVTEWPEMPRMNINRVDK